MALTEPVQEIRDRRPHESCPRIPKSLVRAGTIDSAQRRALGLKHYRPALFSAEIRLCGNLRKDGHVRAAGIRKQDFL